MKKRKSFERAVSPVIATVLLVAIVIVIALIVFFAFRGLIEESITKFEGTNVKLLCSEVNFEATYYSETLGITNLGNIPIFEIKVKESKGLSSTTESLSKKSSSWPDNGLIEGDSFSDNIAFDADKITLIPVLIGNADDGSLKTYVCEENGKDVELS